MSVERFGVLQIVRQVTSSKKVEYIVWDATAGYCALARRTKKEAIKVRNQWRRQQPGNEIAIYRITTIRETVEA